MAAVEWLLSHTGSVRRVLRCVPRWTAGKTTTIGALLWFLRKKYGYKGRILAAAQSNVAVDNMLETAMRECAAHSTGTVML